MMMLHSAHQALSALMHLVCCPWLSELQLALREQRPSLETYQHL